MVGKNIAHMRNAKDSVMTFSGFSHHAVQIPKHKLIEVVSGRTERSTSIWWGSHLQPKSSVSISAKAFIASCYNYDGDATVWGTSLGAIYPYKTWLFFLPHFHFQLCCLPLISFRSIYGFEMRFWKCVFCFKRCFMQVQKNILSR